MNFKKRVNGSWADTPNYIHKTDTDIITTLPAVLYPNDTTATVGLKGNMEQSGTPSTTTPIQPQETGDMSDNILTAYKENYSINASGVEKYNNVAMIYKAEVAVTGSTFTFDFRGLLTGDTVRIHAYTGDTWQEQINAINIEQVPFSFTVGSNIDNIRISIRKTATDVTMTDGQYKIPISSANTTTPIYLGEVETTRRIRKLVLDGTEKWLLNNRIASVGGKYYNLSINTQERTEFGKMLCSHYPVANPYDRLTACCVIANYSRGIDIRVNNPSTVESITDFKSYLQQQYTNGTPVTVWYVLATPETGIVNEPLRKIGDYADTVSGITIPTITGKDTFDVQTTLKPSEVTVNYKGWHPVSAVHERENGAWA